MKIDFEICKRCARELSQQWGCEVHLRPTAPVMPSFSSVEEKVSNKINFSCMDEVGFREMNCFCITPHSDNDEQPFEKVFDLEIACISCDSSTMTHEKMVELVDDYLSGYISKRDSFELNENCRYFVEQSILGNKK